MTKSHPLVWLRTRRARYLAAVAERFRGTVLAFGVACIVLWGGVPCTAATILSTTGGFVNFLIADTQHGATRWTTPAAYTNVRIQAFLSGDNVASVSAFLTTAIGPTTTPADVLASSTVMPTAIQNAWYTLFDGLTLAAGTYYLVLGGESTTQTAWAAATTPQVILGPGVTTEAFFANDNTGGTNPLFAPASNYAMLNLLPWQIEISGDEVPEPASFLLLGCSVIALMARRR